MAHKITDACVSCGSCAENCPVEAISQGGGAGSAPGPDPPGQAGH